MIATVSLETAVAVAGAPFVVSAVVAGLVATYACGLAVVGGVARSHRLVDAALTIAFGGLTVFGGGLLTLGLTS